ncbi:MAG: hypothetical protein KA275_07515 [Chitinophagaceae bacterium]|nr:hypothetical protein [Chitinophagaceae bacterium]
MNKSFIFSLLTLFFASQSFAQDKAITTKFPGVEFSKSTPDSTIVEDIKGNQTLVITNKNAKPSSLNNEKIALSSELLAQPSFVYNGLSFTDFLMNNIKDLVAKCPTGKYAINIGDIVIGKDGKIAFWETPTFINIPKEIKEELMDRLDKLMMKCPPVWKPGMKNTTPVPAFFPAEKTKIEFSK